MDRFDSKGIVFDILRSSLSDGPGIRTSVFLKGCPLNCIWCHNPEANHRNPQLFFNSEKCLLCGACVEICPNDVHHIINDRHKIDFAKCTVSGSCVQVCDQKALKIIGREMSVSEVMVQVMADQAFYQQSGGGMTLSGGEPLAQFQFAYDLMFAAKNAGIHTCIETSVLCSQRLLEKIMPFVDLFLIDYKVTGTTAHKIYTGVENKLILSNLDFIYRNNKQIILRCPVIPDINDTQVHFEAIANLDQTYPDLAGIEILPYHDLGNSKRSAIGGHPTLMDLKTTPPETSAQWINKLNLLGCKKARIG